MRVDVGKRSNSTRVLTSRHGHGAPLHPRDIPAGERSPEVYVFTESRLDKSREKVFFDLTALDMHVFQNLLIGPDHIWRAGEIVEAMHIIGDRFLDHLLVYSANIPT